MLDFDALSFDCYGTLIDWETGIWSALQPLLMTNEAERQRSDVLAVFGELEAGQEAETPELVYPEILARVHAALADRLGLTTSDALDREFGSSVPSWPAFPDSADALSYLGGRYHLVILSNIDRRSFAGSQERLGIDFDAVYTAEDIGSYKPDPANFDYLLDHVETDLGVTPEAILHVAQSLFHDHAPAKAAGLETVWVDRQKLSDGGAWGATRRLDERPDPDHVFFSLAELAEAVAKT
jgi:2-haloalkanoic acid dehalogenase type II